MVNNPLNTTEDMIKNLQELKRKTKLKFYKKICNCYDKMNNKMHEDPFARNSRGVSKLYQEVLLLMKALQTKP